MNSSVTLEEAPASDVCSKLATFEPATETEIKAIILASASKSCALDPLPTWLLKSQC